MFKNRIGKRPICHQLYPIHMEKGGYQSSDGNSVYLYYLHGIDPSRNCKHHLPP